MHKPDSKSPEAAGECLFRERLRIWWLLVLLLGPGLAAPAPAATNALWERVVMIGASVSAGFTAAEPLGGPVTRQLRLNRHVDVALVGPHKPVQNLANTFFFLQPELLGRRQIETALQAKPTVVLGVDFLFWFCYGDGATDEERLRRFEKGLELLAKLPCPLVVGDLPDASAAVNDMLRPEQIPSSAAMASANRRLLAWATSRTNVAVLRLSDFMRAALANQALTVHGQQWREGTTRVLLQADKLHPSPAGCAVVALAALEALRAKHPFPVAEVRWDARENLRLLLKSLPSNETDETKPATPAKPARR
jgi:hypothetical protein